MSPTSSAATATSSPTSTTTSASSSLPNAFSQLGPGVAWYDLDGDGHEDLIVGTGRSGTLAWFRNDGRQACGRPPRASPRRRET